MYIYNNLLSLSYILQLYYKFMRCFSSKLEEIINLDALPLYLLILCKIILYCAVCVSCTSFVIKLITKLQCIRNYVARIRNHSYMYD